MQKLVLILLIIICWLQYSLWFGKNGICDYLRIHNEIKELEMLNMKLKIRNKNLLTEVDDLNQGYDAIEERARTELGMIAIGESFYRIVNDKYLQIKKK